MQQSLSDLLVASVSNTHGSYYASVLAALASRSRATLLDLRRAIPQVSSRDIRLALATLIQQRIVNHYTDYNERTFYEPNWEYAYSFTCRAPTMYRFIVDRFDEDVAEVFNRVSQAGVTSVADLLATFTETAAEEHAPSPPNKHDSPNSNKAHTNGHTEDASAKSRVEESEAVDAVHGMLNLLLTAGYLMRIRHERQLYPAYDLSMVAHDQVLWGTYNGEANTKKEREGVSTGATAILQAWREEDMTSATPAGTTLNANRKRTYNADSDDERPAKRQRQVNGALPTKVNGDVKEWISASSTPLDRDWLLAVNYEKCAVGMRTDLLVRYCERHTHSTTAKVFDALLRVLETKIPRCFDTLEPSYGGDQDFTGTTIPEPSHDAVGLSASVTTRQVAAALDPELDLEESLPLEQDSDVMDSIEGHSRQTNGNHKTNGNHETTAGARLAQVETHLNILFVDTRAFVRKDGPDWRVPFYSLAQRMIESEIENSITHTLGILPARVIRILKFCGHLEILSISQKAMARQESIREACQLLQRGGWADVLEVPKTARREVMKSLWMWTFDVLKAREKMLSDCYFTMSRLQYRLAAERTGIEKIIDKSERSDVVGNEDKYLTIDERATLTKFSRQTNIVMRQMIRMDELVAIMRDFSKMEHPHKLWDASFVDARRLHAERETPPGDEDWVVEEYEEEEQERAFDPDADQRRESSDDEAGA